jgi:uncharacterized protein YgiM (DUF1202 family)
MGKSSLPSFTMCESGKASDCDAITWEVAIGSRTATVPEKAAGSVNLRQRPTRSAPAIGVVAKDAKLRVIGRKNRWVQVTDPATSEKGWIYARHVATVR